MTKLIFAAAALLAISAPATAEPTEADRETARQLISVLRFGPLDTNKYAIMRSFCGTEAEQSAISVTQPASHRMIFESVCEARRKSRSAPTN